MQLSSAFDMIAQDTHFDSCGVNLVISFLAQQQQTTSNMWTATCETYILKSHQTNVIEAGEKSV